MSIESRLVGNLEKVLQQVLDFEFEEEKKLRGLIAETSQRRKGAGLFQTEPTDHS